MPSTGYVNGSDFGIYVDDTLISVALDNQIQFTKDMIEVSNKDSGGDKEYIPGRGDGTTSGSARFKYDAGYGFSDLYALYDAETLVTIRYGNGVDGDTEYSFGAYITDLQMTNPDNDASSISYTFQKTGAVTEDTIGS